MRTAWKIVSPLMSLFLLRSLLGYDNDTCYSLLRWAMLATCALGITILHVE